MRKYHTDHTEKHLSMNFQLTKSKLLGFFVGDLKDTNEGQGVFWPYKKARPIRSGLCVASGVFVPDTSPTINCFIQPECVSFLTANVVCTAYK